MKKSTDLPRAELALVFRRAAQILQARGLSKGLYEQHTGEVCAVGALMAAEGKTPAAGLNPIGEVSQAVWFLSSRITSNTVDEDPIERIADWNDAPERTVGEVVVALVDSARALEAQEAAAIVPVGMRTRDGDVFELASVPAHGAPRYVLAGCSHANPSVFAELGELIDSFGAVPTGGAA